MSEEIYSLRCGVRAGTQMLASRKLGVAFNYMKVCTGEVIFHDRGGGGGGGGLNLFSVSLCFHHFL